MRRAPTCIRVWRLLIVPTVFATAGCSSETLLSKIAPPQVDKYARAFIDTLTAEPVEAVERSFSPRLKAEPGLLDSIRAVRFGISAIGSVDSARLIGGRMSKSYSRTTITERTLQYEVYGSTGVALVALRLVEELDWHAVDALHVRLIPAPSAVINAFWSNLGFAQFVVLLFTLGVVLFSLTTAVMVARSRLRRRWAWVLLTLVGVGKFGFNWTTGATWTHLLSVQLLSASIWRDGIDGPWIIVFSLPIGAVIAFERLRRRTAGPSARMGETPAVDPTAPEKEGETRRADESDTPGKGGRANEPALQFGFRGEDITYREGARECEITFTWAKGDRVYTDTIDRWKDGTPLTDEERERVFLSVLQFVKRSTTRPVIVINTDDPSRSIWDQLCQTHRGMIRDVEYTSDAKQFEFERNSYIQALQFGKLVIDGTEIRDVRVLDAYLAEQRRQHPRRSGQ